jgi:alpha-amylase
MKIKHLVLLVTVFALAACTLGPTPTPTVTPSPTPSPEDLLYQGKDGYPWWNEAVFYEIFVRSFYDSNGDGIGDFNGITEKLDYLNDGNPNTTDDLGVTGIWLMPIFPSPSYHGYDVTDYYSVNPYYGTMDDFKRLLKEAHKRGIRVIIDMVFNHTSDNHPWFQSAKKDVNSPYRDWYIWSETDPGYLGPWGEKVWHPSINGYYYGIFESFMPDLNYNNPEVTAEMDKVTRFWLDDVGVDGFRLDAAKHLIEQGQIQENSKATHAWYQKFHTVYKEDNPNAMMVGEFFGDDLTTLNSYTKGDQLDLAFNFKLAEAFISSANSGNNYQATSTLQYSDKLLQPLQYAPFLTNHDQDRVMSQLGGDVNKAKVAAAMLLTSPGVPFIYYGEELGMQGQKPDEDIRRPMQWSDENSAGFTSGRAWRTPYRDYKTVNVATETDNPDSLLFFYRQLILTRNTHPALQVGALALPESKDRAIFSQMRISPEETLLVLVNLSNQPVSGNKLSLKASSLPAGEYSLRPILGQSDSSTTLNVNANGGFTDFQPVSKLAAYQAVIFQLKGK